MAEERRCNDCLAKITHVAQEVEKTQRMWCFMQERVTREVEEIHQQREERDAEYIRNMARGEDTFKALFGEMHKLREQLVDILTTALKDRNIIEQQINEKNIALAREMHKSFVSKEMAGVVVAAGTIVAVVVIWIISSIAAKDAETISAKQTHAIIQAIQAAKEKP